MAIAKVIGYADNLILNFSLVTKIEKVIKDGKEIDVATLKWVAIVPKEMVDGTYVFDCYAYDDAGNASYLAKMLYTFDTKNLNSKIEQIKYFGVFQESTYFGLFKTNRFYTKLEVLM